MIRYCRWLYLVLYGVLLVFSVVWSGCSEGTPSLELDRPQAVLSPLIVGSASVFLEIRNAGNGADVLRSVDVSMPGAFVELHDMELERMAKKERIDIPARSETRLRPLGPHLMLYKLPADIKSGGTLTLTLHFERSGMRTVSVAISDRYNNTPIARSK